MSNINDILQDLNVSIADIETLQAEKEHSKNTDLKRAVGQLKAARSSIVRVKQEADEKVEVTNGSH
jgi:hypothetical protein